MYKDLKIGLAIGLILVTIVLIRLAADPRFSTRARLSYLHNTTSIQEAIASPNDILQTDILPHEAALRQPNLELTYQSAENVQITTVQEQQQQLPDWTKYEQTEKIKTEKFHIVRKSQSLSAISSEYYGSANKWHKIFNANRDVIKDPNKIVPGTKLIIPD